MENNNAIKLIVVDFLTPYRDINLENGMQEATKAHKYIKLTHIIFHAKKFKSASMLGRATTVILAINCCMN